MSQGVAFGVEDVKAEVSNSPWELRDDFMDEVDVESIAEAAVSYQQAAGEADNAGQLAELATQENVDAGTVDGMSLSDAEGRLQKTLDDVDGTALAGAVDVLHRTVALAEDTVESVENEISLKGKLNTQIFDRCQDAVDELNLWYTALNEAVDKANESEVNQANGEILEIIMVAKPAGSNAKNLPGSVEAYPNGNIFSLPEHIISDIREHHLDLAVDDAEAAAGEIQDHIDKYREDLAGLGAELDAAGYNLSDSPLAIWHTPEMAEYHAQVIEEAVAVLKDDPTNEDALAQLENATLLMGTIGSDLWDENGNPVGEMSPAEQRYLRQVFDNLSGEDLAILGNLQGDDPRLAAAQGNVGTGILALTNPEVGGLEPFHDTPDRQMPIPQSIRDLVYGIEVGEGDAIGFDGPVGYDPETGEIVISGMYEFQGLSNLLANSPYPPGDKFGEHLAESAVDVQQQYNLFVDPYMNTGLLPAVDPDGREFTIGRHEHVEFWALDTGASDVLDVVSRNVDASQNFLLNEGNLENLMGVPWNGHEDGAVGLLETATERGQATEENARQAATIAEDVFTTIGEAPETWRALMPKGEPMSDAVVGIAAQYIDAFGNDPTADGRSPGNVVEGGDGMFYADFALAGRDNAGDKGMDFLEFVGMGYGGDDVDEFMMDEDFALLNLAAREYTHNTFVDAAESKTGWEDAELLAGRLYGNLAYAETASALNFAEHVHQAEALAHERRKMWSNMVVDTVSANPIGKGIKSLGEGILTEAINQAYSGPIKTEVKDLFSGPAPESQVDSVREAAINDLAEATQHETNYTALAALAEAGVLKPNEGSMANSLLVEDGKGGWELVGREEMSKQEVRDAVNNTYNNIYVQDRSAAAVSEEGRPPESGDWVKQEMDTMKDAAHPSIKAVETYTPRAYNEIDNEYYNTIVYGDVAAGSGGVQTHRYREATDQDWYRR